MEMTGEQRIPVPQQRVWEALNDPEILRACIAGCETITRVSDVEYKVVMTAAVGPVKARFNGRLVLGDLNPPDSYSLSFEGSGGAAGFGKGAARVALAPDGKGTLLTYKATATVGGKLAQIGSRLIDGVARKMADDFFMKFNATVAPAAAQPEPLKPGSGTVPAAPAKSGTAVRIGAIVAIAVLMAVLYYIKQT